MTKTTGADESGDVVIERGRPILDEQVEATDATTPPSPLWWLVVLAPVLFWLTHYPASTFHELSHSVTAWILGIKSTPGDIHWGGFNLWNVTMLDQIDEHVDYTAALAVGKNAQVAVVAAAGPLIGNLMPYLVTRFALITHPWFRPHPYVLFLLYWYYFNSLVNLYDYVPTRVFASDGDVTHFVEGSGWSRYWIFVIGGWFVLWTIVDFYRHITPYVLATCGFDRSPVARATVLVLTTFLMFGYFAIPALYETDPVSTLIGRTSLALLPVVLLATWRRNVTADLPAPDLLPT